MDTDVRARFMAKIEVTPGCWYWRGAINGNGYGSFYTGTSRHGEGAHRIMWTLTNGPIPDGKNVLHSCDVRHCMRPDHLFLGTQKENIADMHRKYRTSACGETHHLARNTVEEIEEIRRRYAAGGITQRELGAEYGLPQSAISHIVRGNTWKVADLTDIRPTQARGVYPRR